MASNLERIRKACAEMKRLYGTPEANVKAALRHLLTLYRNAWGPIEENNYKAIFEWAMKNNKQGENETVDYSKKRSALLIQEVKILESMVVHVLSDDESEEPEPPLKCRKRNHNGKDLISVDSSNLQLSRGLSKCICLDEAAPQTKEPAQPSRTTIKDLKMNRLAVANAAPNGRAIFFDDGTPGIGNKKDVVHYHEAPLAVIHPEPLTKGKDNGQSNSNKQPNRHELVGSQNLVNKLIHASEHVHVDTCNGKYTGNSSAESEKKMMDVCNGGDIANSFNMEEDQKHQPPLKVTKKPIYVEDISRGEENEPISLVSDNGSSLELPRFFYISRNIIYRNAYVNFPLDRISDHNCCSNCSGDCLSSPANCACTSETRGDFAYTRRGLVEEKFLDECIGMSRRKPRKDHLYYCENCPLENTSLAINGKQQKRKKSKKACKGHLMRKFIKECWAKCGCSRNCGNRVVQRGITVKLQVFQTPQGKGWGVRTLQELEKGTFVCEYVGEIVTNQELHERNEESAGEEHTYPVLLDADWASERHLKDEEALCLDATKFGNVARFINHRCYDGNLVEIPVEVETPDHHYYHIAFFASRKIEANEELTWDYGIDFDDETHPIKAFECKCGSVFCCMKNRSSC